MEIPLRIHFDVEPNRTWRNDGVLTGYDELYGYDDLYRLNDQKRGTLNGTQTAITSGTFEQQWGLDVGWSFLTVASLTAAAKILSDQDREPKGMNPGLNSDKNVQATTNKANEITGITNSIGAAWATPTNDPARI